jgi:predicted Zn-dependent protease
MQQPAEAERHYRLALDSDPNNRRAGLLLGRLLMQADRDAEAEPWLAMATQGDDSNRAYYLQAVAQVYHETGQRERALDLLEQARVQATAQGRQQLLKEIMQAQSQWQGEP